MKRISFSLFSCLLVNLLAAQSTRELKIGDTLPPLNIKYLVGDSVKTVPLQTFYKDKYVIIDFWATWCLACIKAMSKADSVSKKFDEKLTILPITYQDPKTIHDFILKNKILQQLTLKYIVDDSVLMGGYFKFLSIPHEVWIDTQGIVQAITYPDEITTENLYEFVNNKRLSLPEKKENISFNVFEENLPVDNNGFLYRSVLTEYRTEFNHIIGTLNTLEDDKLNRFFAINENILSMFFAAYSQGNASIIFNRLELNVKDTLALCPWFKNRDVDRQTSTPHLFCYELKLPQEISRKTFYSYLLQDLNRLFPFQASIEKRKKSCWVLINKEKNKNPTTVAMQPKLIWERGVIKKLNHQTMNILVSYLNWNMDLPVINESHFSNPFDMNLDLATFYNGKNVILDTKKVKSSLLRYGFKLVRAERFVDILVIRDKEE